MSSHTGLVVENLEVTLTCLANEGSPTPRVDWKQNNIVINETQGNDVDDGNYNAKKRESLLKIKTDRTLNGAKYQCFSGSLESQEYTLQIKCNI
jgi:hypothetical protein